LQHHPRAPDAEPLPPAADALHAAPAARGDDGAPGPTREAALRTSWRYALLLAGGYLVVGVTYILVSSSLVAGASFSAAQTARLELVKGAGYMALTSVLLGLGARNLFARLDDKNQRLVDQQEDIRRYQEKLRRLALEATMAEERERRRLATDLHDGICQSLAVAQVKLTAVREAVPDAPRAALDGAVALLAQAVADSRTLIFDLSPPILYDLGLGPALSYLAESFEKRHGLRIQLRDDGTETPLDEATAVVVFRSARELLMNVVKHAKVASASVTLRWSFDHLALEVEDGGAGFDPQDPGGRAATEGFGLFSVREQIQGMGGAVNVVAAPHQGTRVSLRLPLRAPREARPATRA
jgi:signal transduction histidine kinase